MTEADFDNDREFDHAMVAVSAIEMLRIVRSLNHVNPRELFSDITQRLEWIDQRRIFLTAYGEEFAVVWTAAGDTDLLKQLSLQVAKPVRWVYVDEATRSWAYLEYSNGQLVESILDPRATWESGTVSGEVLLGQGDRTYDSMDEFLKCIQDRYSPPDMQWSYPAWIIDETRQNFLRDPQVFAWAIEVLFTANGQRITFHGPVPEEVREEAL